MLRNYLAAAFGNLARNWLYAGITIIGLAVSFAAAILIGLYLRDEYGFNRFFPDHERIYRIETSIEAPGTKPWRMAQTVSTLGPYAKLDIPEAEYVARALPTMQPVRRGADETQEFVLWADPDFFKILRFPVLAGDPVAALAAPDGLVITKRIARKYFGEDAPIGKTLSIGSARKLDAPPGYSPDVVAALEGVHPMRVMAVLEDIPTNSDLAAEIYAAGGGAHSFLAFEDKVPSPFAVSAFTYMKLKSGLSTASLNERLKGFAERRYPNRFMFFKAVPLAELHFSSFNTGMPGLLRPPGDRTVDAGIAAVGALIVLIAAINFVTLMTARATRRAVEVGVRKVVGANRRDLIIQFMGEAFIHVLIAMLLAVALAEVLLPHFNAFLSRELAFRYLDDPAIAVTIAIATLLIAGLAGFYPALLLSAFRPVATLKGGGPQQAGSVAVRQVLVMVQFAILIGLIVMTSTIYRQTRFAMQDALRLDSEQVLMIPMACRSPLARELGREVGVKAISCTGAEALGRADSKTMVTLPDRRVMPLQQAPIDAGFFELHGLRPVAGRFFSRDKGEDMMLDRPDISSEIQPSIVLNETGARQLGFGNPADAVGKSFAWTRWSAATRPGELPPPQSSRVIGIVPDFTLASVREPVQPTLYFVEPARAPLIVAKLDGARVPEVLDAVKRIWKRTEPSRPVDYIFESQAVQELYRDVITQGIALAICAGLAICIACLGLFALAAFTTERRTKEIGVRKAMGAETSDIVKLLLWQFTKPVLWANLIAWPLAFWAMDHWLRGFAYRVDLPLWLFAAAAAVAVGIAWGTVSAHAFLVARAKPANALRYE
jgi:putative ABC transport system permease protein